GAPRHLQGADLFRAGPARRAQARRLPHPRQPRGRAQEVRQGQGPPLVPVLEALSVSNIVCERARLACPFCVLAPNLAAARFSLGINAPAALCGVPLRRDARTAYGTPS